VTVQILFFNSLNFFTKMADTGTKICKDIYRKLEKSRVLNIIEDLQIPDILEICYSYNLLWKYVKKYISIQASIFLFVLFILKYQYFMAWTISKKNRILYMHLWSTVHVISKMFNGCLHAIYVRHFIKIGVFLKIDLNLFL
jgi:hypothetical protein